MLIIKKIINLIKTTPFYPFWLESLKASKLLNRTIYKWPKGVCLEVGCGNTDFKEKIILKNDKVSEYVATDYEVTHSITDNKDKKIDDFADAMNLKYKNETFDTHLSFEVLEHMNDPYKFFQEAYRVLKKNGIMIFSVPFLYREHGSVKYHEDYFRFTKYSFDVLAKRFGFKCISVSSNTGVGTTVAILINTYIIRKIYEGNLFVKIIFLLLSPFIFLLTNLLGYIFDIYPDDRYALRYYVIFQKQ